MQSMIEQFDEVMGTVTMLLSGIAAISLLVGGVGIMNIMIVTVTERRKEIGIRKALGATPGAIRMQFLVESATITLFGGFLGIVIGLGLSYLVVYVMNWSFGIQWSSYFISFIFSAFVGVFFGLNPASRAAKLDPVEALASE
jgi:putative ABC transport system permease protein